MTRHFAPADVEPSIANTVANAVLIDAARCWRNARDHGQSVQPCLAGVLDAHGCAMLAPVLDSLIRFYEAALGRSVVVGAMAALSPDEQQLVGLVEGSCPRDRLGCAPGVGRRFDCALCSARIMLALTVMEPGTAPQ